MQCERRASGRVGVPARRMILCVTMRLRCPGVFRRIWNTAGGTPTLPETRLRVFGRGYFSAAASRTSDSVVAQSMHWSVIDFP